MKSAIQLYNTINKYDYVRKVLGTTQKPTSTTCKVRLDVLSTVEGYAKMQVLACKTGLICKIIEPSGFKNKILSTHKAPSHIMTKFLLDQTVLGGFKHANMRNCQVS